MSKHERGCKCGLCAMMARGLTEQEARAQHDKWAIEMMSRYGWYSHFVSDDHDLTTNFNAHTHGLEVTFKHLNFQIVCPLKIETAQGLFLSAVDLLKSGLRFNDGDVVGKICAGGYKVKMVAARECDREVLRIIIPDKHGHLEPDDLEYPFNLQYADL